MVESILTKGSIGLLAGVNKTLEVQTITQRYRGYISCGHIHVGAILPAATNHSTKSTILIAGIIIIIIIIARILQKQMHYNANVVVWHSLHSVPIANRVSFKLYLFYFIDTTSERYLSFMSLSLVSQAEKHDSLPSGRSESCVLQCNNIGTQCFIEFWSIFLKQS